MARVAIDVDGCVADWLGGVLDTIFEVTGKRFEHKDITQWDPWTQCGLTAHQRKLVWAEMEEMGWHTSLQVLPGARDAVKELRKCAEVYAVTSPWMSCTTWHYERVNWLYRHLDFKPEHVVVTSSKHVVSVDFFLDDHVPNVQAWCASNSNGHGYILDSSYNRSFAIVPRVKSLQQFVDIVKSGVKAA